MLADINVDLINFYRVLKHAPQLLHYITVDHDSSSANYSSLRNQLKEEDDYVERASLFWYLNRNCFNGLYRTNRLGHFNVPYGAKIPPFPSLKQAKECAYALRRAELSNLDCRVTLTDTGKGDFVYMDPPYSRNSNRDRGEYGPGALRDECIGEIVDAARAAASRGAKVLFSYNRDLASELPKWKRIATTHRYLISADVATRREMNEYIFRNY